MKHHLREKLVANVSGMAPARAMRLLRAASMLAIVALGMMMWSLVDPSPAPVLLALSIGQVLGTLSFVTFLAVVGWDVYREWRANKLKPEADEPEAEP
jgi:small-conductance mechanosensitive channel